VLQEDDQISFLLLALVVASFEAFMMMSKNKKK
jgi:hypothetical protein